MFNHDYIDSHSFSCSFILNVNMNQCKWVWINIIMNENEWIWLRIDIKCKTLWMWLRSHQIISDISNFLIFHSLYMFCSIYFQTADENFLIFFQSLNFATLSPQYWLWSWHGWAWSALYTLWKIWRLDKETWFIIGSQKHNSMCKRRNLVHWNLEENYKDCMDYAFDITNCVTI